jgi:hypothetical protein
MVFVLFLIPPVAQGAFPTPENPLILKKTVLMNLNHFYFYETGPYTHYYRELEKRTGGRVKVKVYPNNQLGKATEHFELVRKGVADFGLVIAGYTPGFFPLTSIAQLPFPAPDRSFSVVSRVLWELNKKGLLDKTYQTVKVLSLDSTDKYNIFTKKKIIIKFCAEKRFCLFIIINCHFVKLLKLGLVDFI